MPAPELSYAISALGLAALLVALPTIVRAASPAYRALVIKATALTPVAVLVVGAAWVALTASPAHLEAALDGRWPADVTLSDPDPAFPDRVVLAE